MTEKIDPSTGEILETEAIVVSGQPAPLTLFRTEDPDEIMEKAAKFAGVLARAVKTQKLSVNIQGKDYVKVEGWTLLGSLLGVFPVVVDCAPIPETAGPRGHDWQAKVEARTRDGSVVGSAVAVCCRSEKRWASADDYAVASMAQTRATSKALRLPLGFVMQLAGYEPTPSDEIPPNGFEGSKDGAQAHGRAAPAPESPSAPQPPPAAKVDAQGRPLISDGSGYHECPSCHNEAIRLNPTTGDAYCWAKAGGCGAKFTAKVWAMVNGPEDPLPAAPAAWPDRKEADSVLDLTDTI